MATDMAPGAGAMAGETIATAAGADEAACPVHGRAWSRRKAVRPDDVGSGTPAAGTPPDSTSEPARGVVRDADGVWRVRGFEAGRAILRSADTRQAGFKAELIAAVPGTQNRPILYQEGKAHQQQRKQTARFFTPKAVSEQYRTLMEREVDRLIAALRRSRRADLSRVTMALAVRVAAEVVGLTNSRLPGMDRRLDAFFSGGLGGAGLRPGARAFRLLNRARMAAFYVLEVRPAIRARRRAPREDVISHLLALGYNDAEVVTECVTYAAAGMVTTREFICVAAWHLLEHPELRARYLAAPEPERYDLLHETLRLEPVVGHLYRRATADLEIEDGGERVAIPRGSQIDVSVAAANTDPAVVGADALALRPGRELRAERATPALLSFGDGPHRCPGAYIAIQETDIFLRRLLALEGLRIERAPTVRRNELVTGYELRDFRLALD